MNIPRIPHFLRVLHQHCAIAAALFFMVAANPLRAQDAPAPPPAAALDREKVIFEDTLIAFPKGEADVVDQLKPALRKFREERRRVIAEEAKDIAHCMADTKMRDQLREKMPFFTGRDAVSDQFDARWASQTATMEKLAAAWSQWSGGISELHLWGSDDLAPFQTRPDGGDDEEGISFSFPDISFGKRGLNIQMHPPYLTPLLGLDLTLKLAKHTRPLRLDIPLFYKSGESPEKIAKNGREIIERLSTSMHMNYSRGLGLTTALIPWVFEYMFLGEIEAVFVERRTAEETALADGLARFLLYVQILKQDGEEKLLEKYSNLFPFGIGGWDMSDHAAMIATLEKLDPLAKLDRAKVTERLYARNLIALTLVELIQKDDQQWPILHKFKKAGVAIPAGGFTMKSFIAAVDDAYREPGLFQRALAAKKAETLGQLRTSIAKLEKKKNDREPGEPGEPKAPVAPAPMPGRLTAKFDGLTITFPPELKAAVEIVGPEYAKVLAKAREAMEALCKKKPPVALEVTDSDSAALRAYGIAPDPRLLRQFAVLIGAMHDGTQFARWFASGDRMQLWIKEDMMAFMKGGGTVPDFTLDPDGKTVNWRFWFGLEGKNLDADKIASSPAEAVAEAVRRLDAIPHMVCPIVLKRAELPSKPNDPAALAAAIRDAEGIVELMRMATQDSETASEKIASFIPHFGPEQGWFLLAHEVAECAIVEDTIKSADRRWFCDGLANWIAIRDVDRRFGAGKGAETFAKNYDAPELRKHAAKVDLFAWPAAEDVDNGSRPDVEHSMAHYYFATLVIEKACEGRDAGFVKNWLEEIRKTPLNRANSATVLAAYHKLTGKELKDIIREVVK